MRLSSAVFALVNRWLMIAMEEGAESSTGMERWRGKRSSCMERDEEREGRAEMDRTFV